MSRFIYTSDHLDFLSNGYMSMNTRNLTKSFNDKFGLEKTEKAIEATLKNHGIRCGRKGKDRLVTQRRKYSKEQENFIRKEYKKHSLEELTKLFNGHFKTDFTVQSLRAFTKNHKIKSGRTGCFKKTHIPWNTGTKGVMKSNSGNFKKGHTPVNQNPIGHERICSRDGYVFIKVDEINPYTGFRGWSRLKHIVLYEKKNGPVPNGHVVIFKDSNMRNFEPENLIIVKRSELLRLNKNQYKLTPIDLKPSVLALSKLQVKIHEKEKQVKEKGG